MNDKPTLERPRADIIAVAATLSTMIAIGILSAVVLLFQKDGAPMERLAVAERACAGHAYVSEREACMREWLAATQAGVVAKQ
jgi:hypothetical protein